MKSWERAGIFLVNAGELFFANPTVESKSRSGCTSSGW